jgi:methyl-accepting chemotaxis protein
MLAYAVAGLELAHAVAALGAVEPGVTGAGMRTKVLLVATGLIAFAVLLIGPVAYARYRGDLDHEELARADRTLRRAAAAARERGPAAAVELAWSAGELPLALAAPDGRLLAQAGTGRVPVPLTGTGPAVEAVPGGWLVRRPAEGGALVAFVSEAPLVARRRAFWSQGGLLTLGVVAAAGLLVWLVARGLVVPLRYLARSAERVAAGDLTGAPTVVPADEIGRLAAGFRRMTRGLAGLVEGVKEASRGVQSGTRDMEAIGEQVRAGAAEERDQVSGVQGAVEAMQESVALAGRGVAGLSEYVASTSTAVAEMTAALEEVRRQAAELERLAASAGQDVERLAETGQRAQAQLAALDGLAGGAGQSLAAVSRSLESLESSSVASQAAAAQAAELAEHAEVVVREAADGIEGVRATVADAKRRVTVLGRRSDDVDQILDFIGEVAGRTNLLSLNASIIATQAGEHGKAFAVVAEQIRELASQISSSTKSIGEIIRAVREDVAGTARIIDTGDELAAGGVALAHKSLGALQEIRAATARGHETAAAIQEALAAHAASARDVGALVASVAENSKALSEAVQMVGRSVAGIGSVTRGVGGLADRVSRALEEQSGLGRRQLEALERINAMIAEIARAMERHGAATESVQEALRRLTRTAQQHEAAVAALGGLGRRLGSHSQALAERVDRFRG